MRKTALLLAVLLAASIATTADAAKRKRHVMAKPAPVSSNQASANLVTGALSNILMPPAHVAAPAAAPAKKVRHVKRHKKMMKAKKA